MNTDPFLTACGSFFLWLIFYFHVITLFDVKLTHGMLSVYFHLISNLETYK